MLYSPLYTTASLPMMLGPKAQALSYLVPTKYLFLPYSQTQSSEIPYCLEVTNLSSEEFCSLDRTSNSVCQIKRKLRTPRRKNNSPAGVTLKV